jgi:SAM-dependent methyltransferase
MSEDAGRADIRRFWERAAAQDLDRDGLRPTARDPHLQEILEYCFQQHVWPGARLVDVGCGDGVTTLRLAGRAAAAIGIDYIDGFVAKANARATGNCRFLRGDVLRLDAVLGSYDRFDIAVSIRCLINLGSWDDQRRALGQIAACLKPGGLLLISEGWADGFAGLNLRRRRAGLPAMTTAPYNLLIERDRFEEEARRYFEFRAYHCLGPYLYVSRVLQPLLVAPAPPRHDHPLNAVGSLVQRSGAAAGEFADCDYAGAYVLCRKG